jgi:hypothetical protein
LSSCLVGSDLCIRDWDRFVRLIKGGGLVGGESAEQIAAATATPAKGFTLGLRAALMALSRVFRRFFLPYQPAN